jgi:hypothetical protein
MKNFKYMSLMVALLSVLTLSFTSCGDDDDDTVINLYEANIEHEGSEICIQADIKCPGKIAAIIAKVYSADGKTLKLAQPFTGFEGVLEVSGFHKHILDVDTYDQAIVEGDLLKFTVVDQNGNSTTVQKNLAEEDDDEL